MPTLTQYTAHYSMLQINPIDQKSIIVVYDYFLNYVSFNKKNQFVFPEYKLARE